MQCRELPQRDHLTGFQAIFEVLRWLWASGDSILQRSYLVNRHPFVDRELINLLFSVPQTYVAGASVQRYIVSQDCKPLLAFPTDKGSLIPTGDMIRDLQLRTICMLIKLGVKLDKGYLYGRLPHALTRLDPIMVRTRVEKLFLGLSNLASWRHWVKYELKEYFQNILQEERTLSRPFLDADFVKKLTSDHFGHRANYLSEIGKIVTLELWHRHFIDREPVQRGWNL